MAHLMARVSSSLWLVARCYLNIAMQAMVTMETVVEREIPAALKIK